MKNKLTRKKILITSFILIIIALLGGFLYLHYQTSKMYQPSSSKRLRNENITVARHKPISVLLLGTDTGALNRTDRGRTDSIIIATVNPQKESVRFVSLPRDTRITPVGKTANQVPVKLNSLYTIGGSEMTINTLQSWLNVPIDFYAVIDMGGMKKLINDVGGVDVIPPLSFTYDWHTFVKGKRKHLTGASALAFSRMRHDDPKGDYGRQLRQRMVLKALLLKLADNPNLINMQLINDLPEFVQTNLPFNQINDLITSYRVALNTINSDYMQGRTKELDGQDFEIISLKERQRITDLIRADLSLPADETGHDGSQTDNENESNTDNSNNDTNTGANTDTNTTNSYQNGNQSSY